MSSIRARTAETVPPPSGPPPAEAAGGSDDRGPRAPRWVRPVLAVAAVVAVLLLGAAGGLLLGMRGSSDTSAPAADSVDVGFTQDMTVHHEQAVEMAAWDRDHTTDPMVRQIAYDIESTQTAQIGRMQGWLGLWGAGSLPVGGHMAWMGMASHDHTGAGSGGVATMPGMAGSDELRALRAATGHDLDVLFLQLMLRHHEGGASMLSYAAQHATVPEVRNLAALMLSSQGTESAYLQTLLTERGGTPLPL